MQNRLLSSCRELKNIRVLTQCAILIALHILLNNFAIYLTPSIKLTVAYVTLAAIAMLAGPVTAFLCGGVVEILGYALHPGMGAFHPGIALTTMLSGFVMGIFFYKRELKLWRVIAARSTVGIVLNLILNTYWISTLVGKAYLVLLPPRILKTFILLPLEIIFIIITLKVVVEIQNRFPQHTKS